MERNYKKLRVVLSCFVLVACIGSDFVHQHASWTDACKRPEFNTEAVKTFQPEPLICYACVFNHSLVDAGRVLWLYRPFLSALGINHEVFQPHHIYSLQLHYSLRGPPVFTLV